MADVAVADTIPRVSQGKGRVNPLRGTGDAEMLVARVGPGPDRTLIARQEEASRRRDGHIDALRSTDCRSAAHGTP
jgi:hypothetical protein